VFVEAVVLGRQDRLLDDRRDLADLDVVAPLLAKLADQLAVGGPHPQRDFRLVVGDAVDRRQIGVRHRKNEGGQQQTADDRARPEHRQVQRHAPPADCWPAGRAAAVL